MNNRDFYQRMIGDFDQLMNGMKAELASEVAILIENGALKLGLKGALYQICLKHELNWVQVERRIKMSGESEAWKWALEKRREIESSHPELVLWDGTEKELEEYVGECIDTHGDEGKAYF